MTPSYLSDFLSRPEKPEMDVADADALQDEISALVGPLSLLDPGQRDDAAGKQFLGLRELLFDTAAGLRRCPEVAAEVDLTPEVLETTGQQDLATGGFIQGMQAIAAGSDTAQLLAAGEGDALLQQAGDALQAALGMTTVAAATRQALAALFADAVLIQQETLLGALGQPAATPSEAPPPEREPARAPVQQLLADVQAGRETFLSQALAAPPPAAPLKKTAQRPKAARPAAVAPPRGILLPLGKLAGSLLLQPQALAAALGPLGKLAARLPATVLTAAQRAARRPLCGPRLGTSLRNYAYCVRAAQGILGDHNAQVGWPDAARMELTADLMDRHAGINRSASQGAARARDLRRRVGSFQYHVLALVAQAVLKRLEDPLTCGADRARLQSAFRGLLLRKDALLLSAQDPQLPQAQRMTTLLDVIQALRMNLPVEPATLEEAAQTYLEEKAKRDTQEAVICRSPPAWPGSSCPPAPPAPSRPAPRPPRQRP